MAVKRSLRVSTESARGAVLAVHAASGLVGRGPGGRDAGRLLRAAEGLVRAAIAELLAAQDDGAEERDGHAKGEQRQEKAQRPCRRRSSGAAARRSSPGRSAPSAAAAAPGKGTSRSARRRRRRAACAAAEAPRDQVVAVAGSTGLVARDGDALMLVVPGSEVLGSASVSALGDAGALVAVGSTSAATAASASSLPAASASSLPAAQEGGGPSLVWRRIALLDQARRAGASAGALAVMKADIQAAKDVEAANADG